MPADTGQTAKLSPAPVYAEDGSGNTEFIAVEHLTDIDARLPFDTGLSGSLQTALAWTNPANVDDPSSRRDATPDVEATLKQAQTKRYLVVLRSARTPVSADRNSYGGGDALVDAFVVDLKSKQVVASVSARGASAQPVVVDLPAGPARIERANTMIMNAALPELRKDPAPSCRKRPAASSRSASAARCSRPPASAAARERRSRAGNRHGEAHRRDAPPRSSVRAVLPRRLILTVITRQTGTADPSTMVGS